MAGIAGYKGAVYQASGTSTTFTNEACTDSGDHTIYTITSTTKCMWDDLTAVTVQVQTHGAGGWNTVTNYTADYVGGVITFTGALNSDDLVRVSGKYFTITQVATARKWTLDIERNTVDDSVLGDAWEKPAYVQGKASGQIELQWADAAWLTALAPATYAKLIFRLYVDYANTKRYEFYTGLTKDSVVTDTGALVEESIAFTPWGRVYYRST